MSIYRQRDGLFWLSFFSIQNEKEKKILLKRIKENHIDYTANWLALKMLEISGMDYNEYRADDPCMEIACERVALKFMLCDSDLAKDLLTEEDVEAGKKLAVMLKLAVALDRSRSAVITEINCDVLGDSVIMKTETDGNDNTLEFKEAMSVAGDFRRVFKKNLEIL